MANSQAQVTDGDLITPIALDATKSTSKVNMINISNNTGVTVAIDFYLYTASASFYIVKAVDVPTKTALVIDHSIEFDNGTTGLRIHGDNGAGDDSEDYDILINYTLTHAV